MRSSRTRDAFASTRDECATRNEKLVVRDHRQRSTLNAQHSTSNLYRRSHAWVARASRVLVAVSRGDELFLSSCFTYDAEITCEVRERATPSPALGTSALPGMKSLSCGITGNAQRSTLNIQRPTCIDAAMPG